jgi:antitoxin component YwqK of YwqJK toxin-antitoxin module
MKNILIYSVFSILLYSCQSINQKEEKYFKDGTLKEINNKRYGKLHGPYKAYFPNGQLRANGFFKNGKIDGEWKYWYLDGTILSIQEFNHGKLTNLNAWDKNSKQTLKDGTGVAILLYPTGDVMSMSEYKDCQLNGKTETWFENGKKESEIHYINGKPNGTWYFWNIDGTLKKKEEYQ